MSDTARSRRHVGAAARWAMVLGSLVAVLAVDQLTKRWALERLAPAVVGGPREIIEVIGPLQFNLAFNTGASFSLGSDSGAIIGVIAIAIVVVLAFVARKVDSKVQLVLIGIIMGGALGNIIDRLTRVGEVDPFTGAVSSGFMSGAVVDFIDVQFWPIWNVADMAVVVGGIVLAVLSAFAPEGSDAADADGTDADGTVSERTGPVDADAVESGAVVAGGAEPVVDAAAPDGTGSEPDASRDAAPGGSSGLGPAS